LGGAIELQAPDLSQRHHGCVSDASQALRSNDANRDRKREKSEPSLGSDSVNGCTALSPCEFANDVSLEFFVARRWVHEEDGVRQGHRVKSGHATGREIDAQLLRHILVSGLDYRVVRSHGRRMANRLAHSPCVIAHSARSVMTGDRKMKRRAAMSLERADVACEIEQLAAGGDLTRRHPTDGGPDGAIGRQADTFPPIDGAISGVGSRQV
jgi:hypothetical protein